MTDSDSDGYTLALPFLNHDPVFAHGVEVGILWERMKHEDAIADIFLLDNQEQILLMANRLGWVVDETKVREDAPGWFEVAMRRKE